ncbi:hypothetical protein [Anabaena catenula]|uniref:Uncharacterized protein n=1 Tax=Anabaena catenula FACHB-362 TaxID=2692877 RepID=A0ABR8J3Z2_9NOST|nr:hypothetical protein [Anabaena catenula]MBD2692179.1 hypothetical protein [Anabaena catenula FACHB-362]
MADSLSVFSLVFHCVNWIFNPCTKSADSIIMGNAYSLPSVRLAIFFLLPLLRNANANAFFASPVGDAARTQRYRERVFAVYLIRILLVGRKYNLFDTKNSWKLYF